MSNVYIQWKGTEACLDFHCECGHYTHFDTTFTNSLLCSACGAHWDLKSQVGVTRAPDLPHIHR